MKKLIKIKVNGDLHELLIDTRASILEVLRNELGLVGAHRGCDAGVCGACTVHVDGLPMTSCRLLAVDYDGSQIRTVESVSRGGQLHPVQQALVESGGIQCGFCTPGFVMSILALLEENANPTEAQVRERLAGHLCRCTGYVKIVESVMTAAQVLRTQAEAASLD